MMKSIVLISIISITCAFKTNAQVIDYAIDPSFDSGLLFNRGSVSDIILTSENRIFVMGDFSGFQSPISDGAYINFNGSLYDPVNIAGSYVYEYRDGFLQYGSDIRRFWTNPGQLNLSFRFEFKKPAYNGPLSNVALDAMVMPDDHILVAGRFFTDSTLMGTNESHLGLRQLCMIDSTGAPVEDFPMLRCEWPVNAEINSIKKLSTGEFIISGTFDDVDGYSYPKLAKLNADYSVNDDFEAIFSDGAGYVWMTYIDSQDRIWVTMGPSISILDQPDYPGRVIRILPNGTMDTTLQANIYTTYLGDDISNPTASRSTGATILEDSDGTFILGGSFIEVNDEPYNRLIKINDAGEIIDGAFGGTGPDEAVWGSWTSSLGSIAGTYISTLRKLPDGKLLIGGQFSSFGGEPYSCLVRLEPNGFVGVDELSRRGKLKIWPNPSGGAFQVGLPDANERIERVEIYDMQGRTIVHTSHLEEGQARIEIHNLAAGIYLVKAGSVKGAYTQKLIVK